MKFFCKYVLLFLIIFSFYQRGFSFGRNDALLKQGIERAYNFDLDRADKLFMKFRKLHPDDPRSYYYRSQMELWKYLGSSEQTDLDAMLKNADLCIEKLSAWMPAGAKSGELVSTYLGNIYMQKAIAYGKAEKYLDMVNASQKSYSYLSDLVKTNPENYDAYLGLGLFKFALSKVPSSFSYLLNVAGFKTSLEDAYNYVETASKKGNITKIEATYYLAELQREYLNDYKSSIKNIKYLLGRFPGNNMFAYSLGVSYLKDHKLDKGKLVIERIAAKKTSYFHQLTAYCNMLLGDINFYRNKFSAAIPYYLVFFEQSKTRDFAGMAHLRAGISYQMAKNTESAKQNYDYAANGNTTLDDDAYAFEKSAVYKKILPDEIELKLYKYANYIQSGSYGRAVDSLAYLLSLVAAEDKSAVVKYYLSEAYYWKKDYKQSIQFATENIVNNKSVEDWVKPYSYYVLARAYFVKNDFAQSKEMLAKSEKYSDFAYASRLKNKTEALRYRLNK